MFEGLTGHYRTDKNTGHSYAPVYEELMGARRDEVTAVLEIGAYLGDSLRMWRDWFPNANVTCIEKRQRWAVNDDRIRTVIGGQDDPSTLRQAGLHGPFDLIVDDGSHKASHQLTSLLYLWEFVKPGGWYVIEDLQEPDKWLDLMAWAVVDLRGNKGIYDDAVVVLQKN